MKKFDRKKCDEMSLQIFRSVKDGIRTHENEAMVALFEQTAACYALTQSLPFERDLLRGMAQGALDAMEEWSAKYLETHARRN